jgi:MFS family permease
VSFRLVALLIAIVLITGGEELWSRFVPAYVTALGGSVLAVSAYGALHDLLDALYALPGGAITARFGSARSLVAFNLIAIAGYVAFATAHAWWVLIAALPLVMAWESLSLPATFSVIAEALPRGEHASGFAYQSIMRRVPILFAPLIGGVLIARYGTIPGIRLALGICVVLSIAAIFVQLRAARRPEPVALGRSSSLAILSQLAPPLRRLLFADILVRFGEGIGEIFVVLYVVKVLGAPATTFGWLVGLAMLVSIVAYIPAARAADATARKPWVSLTYAFFAAFPLALALTHNAAWLPIAFVCMGLREIGEPARKAMIVGLSRPGHTSLDVGTYYFVRNLSVFPAAFVGGLLWRLSPLDTFLGAAACAAAGAIVFMIGLRRDDG